MPAHRAVLVGLKAAVAVTCFVTIILLLQRRLLVDWAIKSQPALAQQVSQKLQDGRGGCTPVTASRLYPGHRSSDGVTDPRNCGGYQELWDVQFLSDSVRRHLCQGHVPAYTLTDGKFPICQLAHNLSEPVLRGVARSARPLRLFNEATGRELRVFGYSGSDLISAEIARSRRWESDLVAGLIRIAQRAGTASVTFLDVGSNIGAYSLSARQAGLKTVAVDANIRSLARMRLSAREMRWPDSDDGLKLLWAYFSDRVSLEYLRFPLNRCNVGGAGAQKFGEYGGWLRDTAPVMTTTGDALLPHLTTQLVLVKLDIETSELLFLETGRRLFSERRVIAVQMEWWRPRLLIPAREAPNFRQLVDFFVRRNYTLLSAKSWQWLDPENFYDTDTLWVRRDFLHLLLR